MKKIVTLILCGLFAFNFPVVIGQIPELWGTTQNGGMFSQGNIFKVDSLGNGIENVISADNGTNGSGPNGCMSLASNQKLYGMISTNGLPNLSVIFEFDPVSNLYFVKALFDGLDGTSPVGQLTESISGKLYGMTLFGGISNMGVIFEYDPITEIYTKKIDLVGANGKYPNTGMNYASNGKFYGVASGGTNNKGVLFEYDPITNTQIIKVDFDGVAYGENPNGSPIQAANGKLYGTTKIGGTNNYGTLYEYDPISGIILKLLDFDLPSGANPGYLTEASNGKLYGVCNTGGLLGKGLIFEYDLITYTFLSIHDFEGLIDGEAPSGQLIQAANGLIYGLAKTSAFGLDGVFYSYNILTDDYQVRKILDNLETGYGWVEQIQEHPNGKIYGTTGEGGTALSGVFFEYNPINNEYKNLHSFNLTNQGTSPQNSLIQADNDLIYGLINSGGNSNQGVLFQLNPNTKQYQKKVDFNGTLNGANPKGDIVQATNGKLYACTSIGGTNNLGVLFEYDINTNTYSKKLDFDGILLGANPEGSLIQASNSKLYGLTKNGGINNQGVLFEYDVTTSTYTKKHDFNSSISGAAPTASLVEGTNGKLYGSTTTGGTGNLGTLFEFDVTSGILTTVFEFSGISDGSNPTGSLFHASNGKLYGLSNTGGASNFGVLFEYDYMTFTFTVLYEFDGINSGSLPFGSLIESTTGKLYGLTSVGGINDKGVLFEFDYLTSTYQKKFDFAVDGIGQNPLATLSKVFVCPSINYSEYYLIASGTNYTFPDGFQLFNITTNTSHISNLVGTAGCDSIIETNLYIGDFLQVEVFALPVSDLDTCDGYAYASVAGGVAPYTYDWYTQPYNENDYFLDSLCEGFHTLKVTDFIGDTAIVEYYVTDSANFFEWYNATFTGFVDTIYLSAPNCLLNYTLPLDSAVIDGFTLIGPDTIPGFDLYSLGITYYQAGDSYSFIDTVSVGLMGWYLIDFSVYCPIKSVNKIKTILLDFNFPNLLGLNEVNAIESILIFPNPTSGQLTVSFGLDEQTCKIEITDLTGSLVYYEDVQNASNFDLDISSFADGTYFIHIIGESISVGGMIVKQ